LEHSALTLVLIAFSLKLGENILDALSGTVEFFSW
jgi:hypothetical protein